jgi:hypothetical protein
MRAALVRAKPDRFPKNTPRERSHGVVSISDAGFRGIAIAAISPFDSKFVTFWPFGKA